MTRSGRATGAFFGRLQSRVHGLALKSEHAEYAFVHASQGLALYETLKFFDAKCELAKRHTPLRG